VFPLGKKKEIMVKRYILTLLTAAVLVSCGTETADVLKVGMVTDAGTIDDKSFNQGTWEGILKAATDMGVETQYQKPEGSTEADYLIEIGNLYDAGYNFIVTPGFKFQTAIYKSQADYADAKFVLIDGIPQDEDGNALVGSNTVSIFFAEHESGFIAGVAAALEKPEAEFGFIGGIAIPPVQKFNWGFQQGLAYANENLGTSVTYLAENFVYQGTFDNVPAGAQIAAQMYDKGVDVIFTAAGGVGVGAINEAETRALGGEDIWIIGVDVDQYSDGIYEDDKSIILTSAVKKIDQAAYDMIAAELAGTFPGGETITFDTSNNGVGIPVTNPNLSEATTAKVDEIVAQIIAGSIVVSDQQGSLFE
jgi:basic membrane protein A